MEISSKEAGSIKTIADGDSDEVSEDDLKKQAGFHLSNRETLLKHAIIQNASDIHAEPLEDQLLVRYRIDGLLVMQWFCQKCNLKYRRFIKILANLKLDENVCLKTAVSKLT